MNKEIEKGRLLNKIADLELKVDDLRVQLKANSELLADIEADRDFYKQEYRNTLDELNRLKKEVK